ncbi:hypothetical protein AU467_22360 [Mesorhizobium loti]|uniref:Uncharacterized protein n=1 Tax=Rhizobium loti TaxID=381 RepID=A0A101KSU9_RHILI|nr:hypothetical protein AU467_22360 [Mesorhizobium loti]
MRVRTESFIGRHMRRANPFPNRGRALATLRDKGVRVVPGLTSANGHVASFSDGSSIEVDAVVRAAGYDEDFGWLRVPVTVDKRAKSLDTEGISPVPGFYSEA